MGGHYKLFLGWKIKKWKMTPYNLAQKSNLFSGNYTLFYKNQKIFLEAWLFSFFCHFEPQIVLILFLFFGKFRVFLSISGFLVYPNFITLTLILLKNKSMLRILLKLFLLFGVLEPHCSNKIVLIKKNEESM